MSPERPESDEISVSLPEDKAQQAGQVPQIKLMLNSPVFQASGKIPYRYTWEGQNVSIPLEWENVPDGTESFAIVMESADSRGNGATDNWVIYNIPGDYRELREGVPAQARVSPQGLMQGVNSWGGYGYAGPVPGFLGFDTSPRQYVIRIFALRDRPILAPGLSKNFLVTQIEEDILGVGELVGTYY